MSTAYSSWIFKATGVIEYPEGVQVAAPDAMDARTWTRARSEAAAGNELFEGGGEGGGGVGGVCVCVCVCARVWACVFGTSKLSWSMQQKYRSCCSRVAGSVSTAGQQQGRPSLQAQHTTTLDGRSPNSRRVSQPSGGGRGGGGPATVGNNTEHRS